MNRIFRYYIVVVQVVALLFSHRLQAQELLDFSDVQRVMEQILEQHVNKHEVTADMIQNSFKVYIDQFDPKRIYLYEGEVSNFLQMSPAQLEKVLRDYRANEYPLYEELNLVMQNAIQRTRATRSGLMKNSEPLFQKSTNQAPSQSAGEVAALPFFARTPEELKTRVEEDLVLFISENRRSFGDNNVLENKEGTLQFYEMNARQHENSYLYVDHEGRPSSAKERKHLFATRLLKALSKSLDSHTTFLNSNEAQEMKIRLEKGFYGVGVVLQREPKGITIAQILKGSPAEKSGKVHVGDLLLEINGQHVGFLPVEHLMSQLRDSARQNVSLVVQREGEPPVQVKLQRELIAVDEGRVEVSQEPFGDGIIGKIALHSFYQGKNGVTSEKDILLALEKLKREGPLKGLVFDLRENRGGFLSQAVKVAGLFITSGVVVVSKYSSGEERVYRDLDGKTSFEGPVVVLTSRATASAAEIVAQALQDYGVAVVVGDKKTYGKGTIQSQTVTDGSNSSHYKVTIGTYYTVSGNTPQAQGVRADIVVPGPYSRLDIGERYEPSARNQGAIAPSFQDLLADIDPGLRPWFLRYYVPALQKKDSSWKPYLPTLRANSEKRLAENVEYQKFLKSENAPLPFDKKGAKEKPDAEDYQMKEAVNVVKDMIVLRKNNRLPTLAEE